MRPWNSSGIFFTWMLIHVQTQKIERLFMKEHPILFSTPMVRAILDGKKTVTRRIAKTEIRLAPSLCKYSAGDLLWVRETWNYLNEIPVNGHPQVCYKADGKENLTGSAADTKAIWRPSIFMPRWASRITLEITDVKCERLNDISDKSAHDEGVIIDERSKYIPIQYSHDNKNWFSTSKKSYKNLWELINGKDSWNINPLVWVIEFRRLI